MASACETGNRETGTCTAEACEPGAVASPSPLGARLWHGAAWVIAGRSLGIFATVLVGVAAPRLLSKSEYAGFALISSVMIFGSVLALFGLNGAMVRFLAERLGQNDRAGARRALRVGLKLAAVSSLVAAIGVGVYLSVGGLRWFHLPLDPMVVLLACVGLALLAIQQLIGESLRGFHDLRMASVLSGGQLGGPITNLIFLGGMLVVAALLPVELRTVRLTLAVLVGALCVSLSIAVLSLEHISGKALAGAPAGGSRASDRAELRAILPVCWPLAIMGALSFAATQADLWIAGVMCSDHDVALYSVTRRLVVMVAMPLQMVNLTVMASVPSLYFQGRTAELQKLLRISALAAAIPSILALAVMLLRPAFVLGVVFGSSYQPAAEYLVILSLGQLGLVIAGSCGLTLSMTGHQKTALHVSLLSAAVLAIVGPLATHFAGLRGLAIAAVAATLTECGLQWYFTRRLVGVWTNFSLSSTAELWRAWRNRSKAKAAPALADTLAGTPPPEAVTARAILSGAPAVRLSRSAGVVEVDVGLHAARGLWWLHPGWAFALLNGLTMLAAFALSDEAFRLYGTPKYFDGDFLLLGLLAVAAFLGGQWLAKNTGRPPQGISGETRQRLWPWFLASVGLSLFGYIVWFGGGLIRAHSLAPLKAIFHVSDSLDVDVRKEVFPTIPGVTTLTQFGMVAMTLGLLLPPSFGITKKWRNRLLWALGGVAVMRMLLVSERLAVIELAIPAALVALRTTWLARPRLSPQMLRRLQMAPLTGAVGVVLLFGGAEYFRSWRFYEDRFDSFAEFTVWRMSGYYTTAHNNGVMAMKVRGRWPMPYYVLEQFWRFPLVVGSPLSYSSIEGFDPDDAHTATLERFGTPELNNEGGVFAPAMDFGWGGYIIYWLAFGLLAGRLHRGYLAGSLGGMLFYPLVFIAILESPLLLYMSSVRSFPSIVLALGIVGWDFWRVRRPAGEPLSPPRRQHTYQPGELALGPAAPIGEPVGAAP